MDEKISEAISSHHVESGDPVVRPPVTYPRILLIRHGETQWNREGRLQGRMDAPLTLNGMRQCVAIASAVDPHLRALPSFMRLWVSPLGRARQTASVLADCWNFGFERFIEAPAIAERAYGDWEGSTLAEVERDRPKEYQAFRSDPWGYEVPGGESRNALFARIEEWLKSLDRRQAHVVVTHSGCFRAIRALYTGASHAEAETYREPQTTAFLLEQGRQTEITPSPSLLNACGVAGSGRTVEI